MKNVRTLPPNSLPMSMLSKVLPDCLTCDSNTSIQKKGSQAQKQIQAIKSQAASAKSPEEKRKEAEKQQREKEKAASEQAKREIADLSKPVQVQKVPFGVDPKTVLCQYYKQGNCEKGRKCKFSHDLAVERKGEKRNLYQDSRDAEKEREEEERKKDDMVNWDEGANYLSFDAALATLLLEIFSMGTSNF